jgi:large subunit ribosomal protein L4
MESQIFLENLEIKKKAIGLIHRVYLTQLKNSRQYKASTKTKSEVRGGGRKPWKQKGTGNARAGSSRSPLWAGGGVSFGPKPRLVSKKINKKEKRLAIISAFYLKKKKFLFVEDNLFENFKDLKTKKILELFSNLGISLNGSNSTELKRKEKILVLLPVANKMLWLASRNLKNIELSTPSCLNIKQLLHSDRIILSTTSLEKINLTYGKQYA